MESRIMFRWTMLTGCVLLTGHFVWMLMAAEPQPPGPQTRATARKQFEDGNFAEAYQGLRSLLVQAQDDPELPKDLDQAVQSLQRLGRVDEFDEFIEAVIAAHPNDWRLLVSAARHYQTIEKYGQKVAGKFYRGGRNGGGEWASAVDRDRVRALQLFEAARKLVVDEQPSDNLGSFYSTFAGAIQNVEPFRLQALTDLSVLPDYSDQTPWGFRGGSQPQGAPVDAEGNPVYYQLPESWDVATSDGERWRWLLAQAAKVSDEYRDRAELQFADFLLSQFGTQTMAGGITPYQPMEDGEGDGKALEPATGPYALHTLTDDETIARLATGLKRFTLPDEFNPLKIYRAIGERSKRPEAGRAADQVASIYENRRQFVKAAAAWKANLEKFGDQDHRQARLNQIIGNWCQFEPNRVRPAGVGAEVSLKFRNAKQVTFIARSVNVEQLLADSKAYFQNPPRELDWNRTNLQDIGYRLVTQNETKYLGPEVARWSLDLEPLADHYDRVIDVTTPLEKAGVYLLSAQLKDGNTSRILVWQADTTIVRKPLDGKAWYYVADAVTGEPLPRMNVEFFGWRQVAQNNRQRPRIETMNFAEFTDAQGQIQLDSKRLNPEYQWLTIARGPNGRLAFEGFEGAWIGERYDQDYNETKVFTITDRPVYRPEQTVEFKFWIQQAKFDQPEASPYAGKTFTVELANPQGEKVLETQLTADEYGGLVGKYALPKTAMLGVYSLSVKDMGGGSFRVEEYKKPEFEVTVEAPDKPIALGEQFEATIRAKYYFGAPVVNGKVKYKVLRSTHSATWYPPRPWDWFYGSGYGWLAYDYAWYPGWSRWGCVRPAPWYWHRGSPPPEVVAEQEVEIGPDGTVKVTIDTLPAKELHGDQDHSYSITAEVTDDSRRTIVGNGKVLAGRDPFKVFVWVNRGYYQTGDTIEASFAARTLDQKPVAGKGVLKLFRIRYDEAGTPSETEVQSWDVTVDAQGSAQQRIAATEAGQYRLSLTVTDAEGRSREGGYVFVIRGEGFDGREFRFNDLELMTDKAEYAPGETVRLMINSNRANGTVVLFVRPTNGTYLPPKLIKLTGKSQIEEIALVQQDMPNFFVEAFTIADGRYHEEAREIYVPPEKRVLDVTVEPSKPDYRPGEEAEVRVRLQDLDGKPFIGSTVLSVYDQAVEYISGGSNIPEIREFFWKWRRHHSPVHGSTLDRTFHQLLKPNEVAMAVIGMFGDVQNEGMQWGFREGRFGSGAGGALFGGAVAKSRAMMLDGAMPAPAAMAPALMEAESAATTNFFADNGINVVANPTGPEAVQPTVRTNFADTAFWAASITTDADGYASVKFPMPDSLTAWKIRAWGMGLGAKVGEGESKVVTSKNLLVRLQAPRFFVETDEVVLSANVHNYLKTAKSVEVVLELEGNTLTSTTPVSTTVEIPAEGEHRVDWRVKVTGEGSAIVRMKALTDEESDAMQMTFPVYVHGMLKTESFAGALRPEEQQGQVKFTVPEDRRINESRLEVRYSPTLAGAMVDALPYLVDYPYGCTEQTLNRFLPTVITQRILQDMQIDLKAVRDKRTNLNAQEIGDAARRAEGWKRFERNPVFDEAEVTAMVKDGIDRLTGMQCSDGGWGWFSGYGEHSWPHTTAVVVHGLQIAKQNDVAIVPGVLERGIEWLKNHQAEEVRKLKNAATETNPWKNKADALDALIYGILVDADIADADMEEFLYRDRVDLPVYAKAVYGLALHKQQRADKLTMILQNIEQFLVQDNENQTAYLKLPENKWWWSWHGGEIEANAWYLKLLTRVNPQDVRASRLVKYLLNNRKNATYWNSTRDTAYCIEALAEFLKASGENRPDLTVEVWLDGQKHKEVAITSESLFTFDGTFVLEGDAVTSGEHTLELRKSGSSPLYYNVYMTNFTKEDFITAAGLEVKVNRKFYKLTPVEATADVAGSRGQVVSQKVEKFERTELPNLSTVQSGDLIEVELEIDSKNDYEYLVFEDMKAAGNEPVEVRSGYLGGALGAYTEFRDERVCFFVRSLPRGKHSVSYRVRAEIPGQFSALPTKASAMYAPELRGNSDEMKLIIED
jgi:uncharacterized protein YfaS (alpha-2-macroglobulin family)